MSTVAWRRSFDRRAAGASLCGLLLLGVGSACATRGPASGAAALADLRVSGLGWMRDRELTLSLERLLGGERGEVLSTNALEDAIFLLLAALQEEGFLHPVITAECTNAAGRRTDIAVHASLATTVPAALRARAVRFRVQPGPRFFVSAVSFSGLHVLAEDVARGFFVPDAALFAGKSSRAYTPARLARAVDGLQAELRQLGYAEALARAEVVSSDARTGAVRIAVQIVEGVRWRVRGVRIEGRTDVTLEGLLREKYRGQPWTEALPQSLAGEVRKALYAQGYADARVRVSRGGGDRRDGEQDVDVSVQVRAGEIVRIDAVRFVGGEGVKESLLRRRVRARAGDPLDPSALEQSRYRLARLGVFDQVGLRYEPATGPRRSPVFSLRGGRSLETNLFLGYGTYEQVRGAVELRQFNLFGRAHQSRLLLAQSMKGSRAEYAYTVPELFGEAVDGTVKVFGLQRAELAFQRQEFGATAAVSLPVRSLGAAATLGYTLQSLRNRENELATRSLDAQQVTVASLDAGLTRDRRDSPLRPRRGYRWFGQLEAASRGLGGGAEFQRFEMGGSYHTGWGRGRWVHVALTHGVITTWGTDDRRLPVNKRFYPGGGNSLRGYQEGEASPRGAAGRFIGAKSYTLANLELEQALAAKWSLIALVDALATTAELRDYPVAGERLSSAGLGLRYQTLIGPIRVEYGRNLQPRPGDPGGTWQIAVGAPF